MSFHLLLTLVLTLFLAAIIYTLVRWAIIRRIKRNPLNSLPGPPLKSPFFGLVYDWKWKYKSSCIIAKATDEKEKACAIDTEVAKEYLPFGEILVSVYSASAALRIFLENSRCYQ